MIAKPILDFISQSPDQTVLAGELLGQACEGGEVIRLEGPLGAGKTVLAQGIARGLGITVPVTSPTFTLLKEYQGRLTLYHFDFYRLQESDRNAEREFAEYFQPDAVCVIEWAEYAHGFLPEEHLHLSMRYISTTKRALVLTPHGAVHEALVRRFREAAFR
jgi:tRNA threonylcarbamoyladenosine biosynthesis protein TsaE